MSYEIEVWIDLVNIRKLERSGICEVYSQKPESVVSCVKVLLGGSSFGFLDIDSYHRIFSFEKRNGDIAVYMCGEYKIEDGNLLSKEYVTGENPPSVSLEWKKLGKV